jgi:hypothetical protein
MAKRFFLAILKVWMMGGVVWGQTTIASDGLNNSTTLFTLSNGAYYTGNSASGDRPASSAFAIEGTHSRGISNGTATLTSNDISTTGYTSISLTFRVAAFSISSTGNGVDAGDIITVEVSPNGGTNYYSTVRILGNSNAYWSYSGGTGNASTAYDGNTSPTDFQPSGGGNRTTDGYSTVTVSSLPETNNLKVRITLLNNDANERWVLDDFKVIGTPPSCSAPTAQATTFNSSNVQTTQMDISWTRGNGDNVLVVARQGSAVNSDPTNGQSYTANPVFMSGDQIGTGNYVVYNGTGTSVTVTGLSHTTTYHFAIYEYFNSGVCYNLTELTGNATTATPPPNITHTGTSQAATNIIQNTTNNVLYRIKVDVTTTAATLTQVVASTGGSWINGDISNFKLWFSTDATFGSDATISTVSNPAPGDITFTVSNQAFPINTRYLFITCDVAAMATIGNTVSAFTDADGDFTYSVTPTYAGSSFAAGELMTIIGYAEIQLESPVSTDIACGASALNFGNVPLGTTGSMTVRIRNNGTGNLILSGLPLSPGGTHAADYSITTQPTSPVAPGGFTDMVVQFNPSATGTRTSNITIANNDSDESSCIVNFTGTGTAPEIQIKEQPAGTDRACGHTFALGTINIGNSASVTIRIQNTATNGAPLNLTNLPLTITGSSDFSITTQPTTPIASGNNFSDFVVQFTPSSDGAKSASISIGNNDTNENPCTINLSGTGFQPYYFRTTAGGDWTTNSPWEFSLDNNSWSAASRHPTSADNAVSINANITLSSSLTIDELTILPGGTLDITGGTFTVNNGSSNPDILVQGILKNSTTTGFTVNSGANIVVDNGGKYQHNPTSDAGSVTTMTWNSGATCEILKSSGAPGNLNQAYHHFTWASTTQGSGNINLIGNLETINGDFNITNTGTGSIRLTGSSENTLNIAGDLNIANGTTLSLGNGSAISTVNIDGDLTVNGALNMMDGGSNNGFVNLKGNLSGNGTITEATNGTGCKITFNGTSLQTAAIGAVTNVVSFQVDNSSGGVTLNSNLAINSSATLTVNGILDAGSNVISGPGAFTLSNGATFKTSNSSGIVGSITVTGAKTFSTTANYTFNNATTTPFHDAQSSPVSAANVTLGNSITLNKSLTVSGTLDLSGGYVTLGSNTLTIGNAGGITGASAASYVVTNSTGKLKRNAIGNSNVSFPVGDNNYYAPATLSNAGTSDNFSVGFSQTAPGCFSTGQQDGGVTATWDISEDNAGQSNCTISFDVGSLPAGNNFILSEAVIAHCNGTTLDYSNGSVSGNIVTGTGFTSFSPFGVLKSSALPIELVDFQAIKLEQSTLLTWITATELNNDYFAIERSANGSAFREIGRIAGKGNSFVPQDYHFSDKAPLPGMNYYRLRQVDFDGEFTHSDVQSVRFEANRNQATIQPTLASNEVRILFPAEATDPAAVELLDFSSRILQVWQIEEANGDFNINVSELKAGVYFLKIESGKTIETHRFVKQ